MSINLDAYDGREMQHFIMLLNQAEESGITDTRVLRSLLNDAVMRIVSSQETSIPTQTKTNNEPIKCPSCNNGYMVFRIMDGFKYSICNSKCGWSQPVNI